MLKAKVRRTRSSMWRPMLRPKVKNLARLYAVGTDIEAFYAAQKAIAADSREYVERRRTR